MTGAEDFVAALRATEADQTASLTVVRDGKELSIEAKLDRRPLEIIRPEFDSKPLEVADKEHDPLSLLLTLAQAGGARLKPDDTEELAGVQLREAPWQVVSSDEQQVTFRRTLPALAVEVTKRYTLGQSTGRHRYLPMPPSITCFSTSNCAICPTRSKRWLIAWRVRPDCRWRALGTRPRSAALGARPACAT